MDDAEAYEQYSRRDEQPENAGEKVNYILFLLANFTCLLSSKLQLIKCFSRGNTGLILTCVFSFA